MHGNGPALAVHFLLVQTTKSIVPSPHPNVGFESQSMWRPYRLGCSRWVPDRVANYEPQKEPDPSEQLPIVLQSTFRCRRTLMMRAPAMCGPPDPGRLELFEGPIQRGRISNGRGGRIALPSLSGTSFNSCLETMRPQLRRWRILGLPG